MTLQLAAGERVALVGESGVGKSTLLNCIAGLDDADEGRVLFAAPDREPGSAPVDVAQLGDDARAMLRRRHFGFVFQAFHVLPHLSVQENVALPLQLLGLLQPERVREALDAVGLAGLGHRMPSQLSGGQLQRVAMARAFVHRPAVLLADEPTGNLDPTTAERVLDVLAQQARQHGTACLLVTHSLAATRGVDRVLRLTPTGLVE